MVFLAGGLLREFSLDCYPSCQARLHASFCQQESVHVLLWRHRYYQCKTMSYFIIAQLILKKYESSQPDTRKFSKILNNVGRKCKIYQKILWSQHLTISAFCCFQGMQYTYLSTMLSTLEKKFGIKSKETVSRQHVEETR